MTPKPLAPLRLFKVLILLLAYFSVSVAWLFFGARHLISSASDIEVITGFLGTAIWLISSACLLLAITRKPGHPANTSEKHQ